MGAAFPPHYYDQERLIEAFRALWGKRHHNLDRIERLHRNVLVGGRHLALPLEEYVQLDSWGKANDAWIRVAQEVGAAAVRQALDRAGLGVDDVAALYTVTVTGSPRRARRADRQPAAVPAGHQAGADLWTRCRLPPARGARRDYLEGSPTRWWC